MSEPVLDEARLAAIQQDHRERHWEGECLCSIDFLLAHVGVLRADNQRLRYENEKLRESIKERDIVMAYPPRRHLSHDSIPCWCGQTVHPGGV